jgi:S1-C subfamily serine protease
MSKVLSLLTFALLLIGCQNYSVQKQNLAIVKVEITAAEGRMTATAFHIGEGLMLTNQHVCDEIKSDRRVNLNAHNKKSYKIQSYYNSRSFFVDLCLLKTNAQELPALELELGGASFKGQVVTIEGYPAGFWGRIQGVVDTSQILAIAQDPFGIQVIPQFLSVINVVSIGGVSGSPVFSQSGIVIGVVNAGGGGRTLFVPALVVQEFLKDAIPALEN